jgi:hypothetical protein
MNLSLKWVYAHYNETVNNDYYIRTDSLTHKNKWNISHTLTWKDITLVTTAKGYLIRPSSPSFRAAGDGTGYLFSVIFTVTPPVVALNCLTMHRIRIEFHSIFEHRPTCYRHPSVPLSTFFSWYSVAWIELLNSRTFCPYLSHSVCVTRVWQWWRNHLYSIFGILGVAVISWKQRKSAWVERYDVAVVCSGRWGCISLHHIRKVRWRLWKCRYWFVVIAVLPVFKLH